MADKDKKLTVKTITGDVVFFGSYRRDLEESNWHYYETDSGQIYHFRKEHMVAVLENAHLATASPGGDDLFPEYSYLIEATFDDHDKPPYTETASVSSVDVADAVILSFRKDPNFKYATLYRTVAVKEY